MSWDENNPRAGNEDLNLMGVHGDTLFADPVGARKDKGKQSSSRQAGGAGRHGAANRGKDSDLDDSSVNALDMNLPEHRQAEMNGSAHLEEPQEDAGPVRAWFGYLFGGGTQCCGNRDRAKDAEAAKKASVTGRPPAAPVRQENFPDPPNKATPSHEPTNGRRRGAEHESEDTSSRDRLREKDDPFGRSDKNNRGGGGLDELHKFASEPDDAPLRNKPEERQPAREPPKPQGSDELGRRPRHSEDELIANEKPPEGHLPRTWQWPPWTLATKEQSIEVYVVDDDSGEKRWCEAEPQFRVVDKEGHDAYLCAEYEWDGEFYVQDFGPHHVRKRGQDMTVFQLFTLDPSSKGDDFLKDTSKSIGRRNLDDTDPFMTSKPRSRPEQRNDSGGGVNAWLNDD